MVRLVNLKPRATANVSDVREQLHKEVSFDLIGEVGANQGAMHGAFNSGLMMFPVAVCQGLHPQSQQLVMQFPKLRLTFEHSKSSDRYLTESFAFRLRVDKATGVDDDDRQNHCLPDWLRTTPEVDDALPVSFRFAHIRFRKSETMGEQKLLLFVHTGNVRVAAL